MPGTNCPIPPGRNYTYKFQMKDQIGSYYYFPSMYFHKAAGGFGGIKIVSRPLIPVPFPPLAGDYTVLIGDWYKTNHSILRQTLDSGSTLGMPDGVLINGQAPNSTSFTVDQGKTYRLRISNVGLASSLNFRIQGHKMKLVEVEGSHTVQNIYDSLDVHSGQSYSVLVTADQPPQAYYVVASTRFTTPILTGIAFLRYSNSQTSASGPLPPTPTGIDWSLNQARSIRWNLTASGPRPNPQGSYHYGMINTSRTIILANSAPVINGKQRYAVNSISFIQPDTPLKLADYLKISGVFNNSEDTIQSWHLDGYSFFVLGMDGGQWTQASMKEYNLFDTLSRCTTQVYPNSWTAIRVPLDNVGMWNLRSENWAHQYLGQQFYLQVYSLAGSFIDEYSIPNNALKCGRAG
eukprot:PITA_20000